MPAKPSDDKPKVMDVSKPGKGKIMVNSRPIAAPVVGEKATSNDVLTQPTEAETAPVMAPSAAKKVIQPINILSDDTEKEDVSAALKADESATEETFSDLEEPANEEPVSAEAVATPEVPAEDMASQDAPETTDSLPTPRADGSPIAPEAPATDQSGAASVDELAKAAEQKRLAAEKSKEEVERDKKVQELINSKQYHVPIKHAKSRGHAPLVVLIVLLIAAAAYLIIDIGVAGSNIKLPFEFFKEETVSDSAADSDAVAADPAGSQLAEGEKNEEPTSQTDPGTVTPEDRAADEAVKNELKKLQQKLETYFNDNDAYPASLADLTPKPTADELQDDKGQAYTYVTDEQTYTLNGLLSDGSNYTLQSTMPVN